jgi:hypothetical protein
MTAWGLLEEFIRAATMLSVTCSIGPTVRIAFQARVLHRSRRVLYQSTGDLFGHELVGGEASSLVVGPGLRAESALQSAALVKSADHTQGSAVAYAWTKMLISVVL